MAITKGTVQYVAHLARIELSNDEIEKLSHQLQDILGFIDKLNKVDVAKISPTSHILPINSVLREDLPNASLSVDKVLKNAPRKEKDLFVVPKIID